MSAPALSVRAESWPIHGGFRIARGEKRDADVVVAEIAADGHAGRGECVPYARYGETVESVRDLIAGTGPDIAAGLTRAELQSLLPAGAARNALDCALIDLEAKRAGIPAHRLLGLGQPRPMATAFTLSLDDPAAMGAAAKSAVSRGFRQLKLKIAGGGDVERARAVRAAAPDATLIVDANEGWTAADLPRLAPALGDLGVVLIEQPVPAAEDDVLQDFVSPVPLCADESCHTRADLPRMLGRYAYINIKLDKTGGLTEALALALAARESGLGLMVGCMVSTSLAMAPALLIGAAAQFVDLDGHLLLEKDRKPGLRYERDLVYPAPSALWG